METIVNPQSSRPEEFFRLQDLLAICARKWPWFVLSLAICTGLAVAYLLVTPPVYTRSASLLIKEDGKKGGSVPSEMGSFVDMGLFSVSTSVANEQISIQSPDLLLEVIRRLSLDVSFQADGTFRKEALYGRTLPIKVEFKDIAYNDFAAFTVTIRKNEKVVLSDFLLNGEEVEGGSLPVIAALGKEVKTPLGRLVISKSPYYKETARDGMDIHVSRSGLLAAIAGCKANLTVALSNDKGSIIDISYRDVSIQRAEEFLNTLISVYNESWVKDRNQIAVSTSQFINERLKVIESELGTVDSDISSYKSENLIPDVEAASQMYMNTANQASMQISDLNNQLYMARYIREHVSNKNSRNQLLPANSGINSGIIEQQISEYNEKMLQRNSLAANSSAENPLVVDMDSKLGEMRAAIVSSIDNQVNTLNTQIRGLRGIEGSSTSRLASNPKQSQHLLSVERQPKVKESLYLFLLQKREENELSQAFTAYNTRVITSPTGEMRPVSPNRRMILLAAVLIGLLVPAAAIYVRESANTKVRGRKDLSGLKAPFIGEIPLHREAGKHGDGAIVVADGSRDVINEAFRVVRTNIEFMVGKAGRTQVIAVTSFNPGSGKSFLTMNLATSFAIKKKKVLVIDGDLRHASTSAYVHSPRTGLSDYLSGGIADAGTAIVRDERHPSLSVLPVGTIPPNPTELLFDERLPRLIEELRKEYEYIFIDCPPIDIVADTQILEQQADRTIFVVRSGLLEKEMLAELDAMYEEKRLKNMSVILNGTETAGGRYGYRYGYGYGASAYYGSAKRGGGTNG